MQAWFISDLHLKSINERSSIILLRFLRSLIQTRKKSPDECTHLFLLGDIFDLWVSDAPVFIRKFQAIIDDIVELKRLGVEVVYFEGNHDVHVKKFWEQRLGIPTYVHHQIFELGPYSIRLEHGDLINHQDQAYLKYRGVIRHPVMEKLAPVLAGRILNEVGQLASKFSRKKSSVRRDNQQEELRSMIRSYAQKVYAETPFDLLVTGHMHVQDDFLFEVGGESVRSVNLGSWFDGPKALKVKLGPAKLEAEFINLA